MSDKADSKVSFSKPVEVSKVDLAFGGDMKRLLPEYKIIPDDFKNHSGPWVRWQQHWFFKGLDESMMPKAKAGIDRDVAIKHLAAIQGSWEPKHEHKEAGVAYLASMWFEECPLK